MRERKAPPADPQKAGHPYYRHISNHGQGRLCKHSSKAQHRAAKTDRSPSPAIPSREATMQSESRRWLLGLLMLLCLTFFSIRMRESNAWPHHAVDGGTAVNPGVNTGQSGDSAASSMLTSGHQGHIHGGGSALGLRFAASCSEPWSAWRGLTACVVYMCCAKVAGSWTHSVLLRRRGGS